MQSEIFSSAKILPPQQLKEKVNKLKESTEGEIKTNIQIYSHFQQQPIKFGSLIHLQHLASGKFLSIVPKQNAKIEKDNLKVELVDFFSDNSLIRMIPAYKFQKEGNSLIKYNEQAFLEITIPGTSKFSYLHSSSLSENDIFELNCSLDLKTK